MSYGALVRRVASTLQQHRDRCNPKQPTRVVICTVTVYELTCEIHSAITCLPHAHAPRPVPRAPAATACFTYTFGKQSMSLESGGHFVSNGKRIYIPEGELRIEYRFYKSKLIHAIFLAISSYFSIAHHFVGRITSMN